MVKRYGLNIVEASLELHKKVASTFLPTAIKFHYNFNLRDLSNIYQVIYQMDGNVEWVHDHMNL